MDMVRKLILDLLEQKGLTMSEASMKIGKNHAYLQQFLKRGYPLELPEKSRLPLAELLGVPEDDLRGPSSKLPPREYTKKNGHAAQVPIAGTQPTALMSDNVLKNKTIPGERLFGDTNDLPIFGTADAGLGALIVTDSPVDWVVRPAPLLRVRDGYGMIVSGDSMSPELKSGSIVLVNPHLPARVGDTCIFRGHAADGTDTAIIKELRGQTDTLWKVRQHNPPKDFTLKKADWQDCHKTVGNYFA